MKEMISSFYLFLNLIFNEKIHNKHNLERSWGQMFGKTNTVFQA